MNIAERDSPVQSNEKAKQIPSHNNVSPNLSSKTYNGRCKKRAHRRRRNKRKPIKPMPQPSDSLTAEP